MKTLEELTKRLIELTYNNKLSHLSSTLSALPILMEIYNEKKDDEVFILSNGHAGMALYTILEDVYGHDPQYLFETHGYHPVKDLKNHIYCSSGSLGCGLPIAVGHALANRNKNVYCMISDGECAEGSIYESLNFCYKEKLTNLRIYVNLNGQSATDYVDSDHLENVLTNLLPWIKIKKSDSILYDFANPIRLHYYVLNEDEYIKLRDSL